jgi:hypothetical protein
MRSSQKPATLAELLGKDVKAFSLKDLPSILGEKMPDLPRNRVGKFRLMNALKIRFGSGYKNIPGISNILSEFDKNANVENIAKMNEESRRGDTY